MSTHCSGSVKGVQISCCGQLECSANTFEILGVVEVQTTFHFKLLLKYLTKKPIRTAQVNVDGICILLESMFGACTYDCSCISKFLSCLLT